MQIAFLVIRFPLFQVNHRAISRKEIKYASGIVTRLNKNVTQPRGGGGKKTVMETTPEEIKFFARNCYEGRWCGQCPYHDYDLCVRKLMEDEAEYIEQLEATLSQKTAC